MKMITRLTLSAAFASSIAFTALAETAYTNPVVAASNEIAGNGGSAFALTALGISALNPIEATGTVTSHDSVDNGNSVLVVTNVPLTWASNDFANPGGLAQFSWRDVPLYYVKITSGNLEGQVLDVVATVAGGTNTLTVGGDVSASAADLANATFEIRKAHTIASIFGDANDAGLLSGQDSSASTIIYNLYQGTFEIIYYQTDAFGGFFGGDGWRKQGDINTDVSNTRIDPDFGLLIGNRSADPLDLVSVGDVYLGQAKSTISPGFNALIYKFPVDTTLADSNLYTDGTTSGLASGQDSSEADIIYLLDTPDAPDQWSIYYYQIDEFGGFFGGDGWRRQGDINTDKSSISIPAGSTFVVLRRAASATEWVDAQPFSL